MNAPSAQPQRTAPHATGAYRGSATLLQGATTAFTLLLAASMPAQNLAVSTCGGAVGQNVDISVTDGQPNAVLLRVLSLQRAQIPLALIDPSDPRMLGVSPDLIELAVLDGAGSHTATLAIPNNPALSGTLAQQALTLVGITLVFDEVSEVAATPFGVGGIFAAETATMAASRTFATTIPLPDGHVLIVGGGSGQLLFQNATATTEIWDPVARTLQSGPSMVSPRAAHTMTRLQDGRYLLVGGVNATNIPQTSCEIFDPLTNTFTATASMSVVRAHHTATLLSDGRVLIAGGIRNMLTATLAVTSSTPTTTIYNPVTNTWSTGPNMVRPRGAHSAVHLGNGTVLICGGISHISFFGMLSPNLQARAEIFNEASNTFSAAPNMATQRALAGAFLLPNGRALLIGGMTGNVAAGGVPTALCETYNPTTNSWATSPPRSTPLAVPQIVTLADGAVVSFGGADGDLFAPLPNATCELLDPTTGAWSSFPSLSTPRAAPLVVPLPSCSVAVFGGSTTNTAISTNTIELLIR